MNFFHPFTLLVLLLFTGVIIYILRASLSKKK